MNKKKPSVVILVYCYLYLLPYAAYCQKNDNVIKFIENGKECYNQKDFFGAADEFENALLLDSSNIEAKIWLAKSYIDLKMLRKAQDLLNKARRQAPENPEVIKLFQLLGADVIPRVRKEPDPVIFETIALIGSNPSLRPFGLVIPESKVKTESPPTFHDKIDEIEIEAMEPATESMILGGNETGPLAEAFNEWAEKGLSNGLDKYFDIVLADKALGAIDDHRLLQEGFKFFQPRFQANQNDNEARFYVGMILYFNGDFEGSAKVLNPLRDSPPQKGSFEIVISNLDKTKTEREAIELAMKREKEAQEAAEKEAERIAAEQKAAAANPAGTGTASSSETLDFDGYENYKRGNLDVAIEKFNLAIKADGTKPKIYYHLGQAFVDKALAGETDNFDRAIEAFNNVIRLEPSSKLAKDSEIMIKDIVAAKNSLKQ
ncbi:tetratricopeptide repeat protein [bacterium]|nr:tetratricopeptide repeat protein [bacterium]